jgi:hypothetical protein
MWLKGKEKAVYGLPDDYDHNNPPAGTKKFNAEPNSPS